MGIDQAASNIIREMESYLLPGDDGAGVQAVQLAGELNAIASALHHEFFLEDSQTERTLRELSWDQCVRVATQYLRQLYLARPVAIANQRLGNEAASGKVRTQVAQAAQEEAQDQLNRIFSAETMGISFSTFKNANETDKYQLFERVQGVCSRAFYRRRAASSPEAVAERERAAQAAAEKALAEQAAAAQRAEKERLARINSEYAGYLDKRYFEWSKVSQVLKSQNPRLLSMRSNFAELQENIQEFLPHFENSIAGLKKDAQEDLIAPYIPQLEQFIRQIQEINKKLLRVGRFPSTEELTKEIEREKIAAQEKGATISPRDQRLQERLMDEDRKMQPELAKFRKLCEVFQETPLESPVLENFGRETLAKIAKLQEALAEKNALLTKKWSTRNHVGCDSVRKAQTLCTELANRIQESFTGDGLKNTLGNVARLGEKKGAVQPPAAEPAPELPQASSSPVQGGILVRKPLPQKRPTLPEPNGSGSGTPREVDGRPSRTQAATFGGVSQEESGPASTSNAGPSGSR